MGRELSSVSRRSAVKSSQSQNVCMGLYAGSKPIVIAYDDRKQNGRKQLHEA